MKLNKIEHVFFDLDHTLWDFDKNSEQTFEFILRKNKINVELEEFLKVYMPINLKYWRMFRNDEVSKEELRYGRLKESFDFLKLKIDDKTIHLLSEDYIKFLPDNNYLLEGTMEILEYLQKKYKLHIITNGFEEVQQQKLKNSKIDSFFETVTTSEEVGVKKPHAQIFKAAFLKSKATEKNSIMVGDSIEADVLGAKNIGMEAIYFNYYKSELPVEYREIKELSALTDFL